MRVPRFSSKWLVPLVLAMLGCQPEIGDACTLHTDCSSSGDRLCDPTLKGGYCTISNCEPGSCPEEAVCVAYQTVPGSDPEDTACRDTSSGARLARTYCMRSCSSEGDCRSGYSCLDLSAGNPWGAEVVEHSRSRKICTIPASIPAERPLHETGVCDPPNASFPDASVPVVPDASTSDASDAAAPGDSDAGDSGAGGRDGGRDGGRADASDAASGGSTGAGGASGPDSGAGGAPSLDGGPDSASGTGGRDAASDAQGDR